MYVLTPLTSRLQHLNLQADHCYRPFLIARRAGVCEVTLFGGPNAEDRQSLHSIKLYVHYPFRFRYGFRTSRFAEGSKQMR